MSDEKKIEKFVGLAVCLTAIIHKKIFRSRFCSGGPPWPPDLHRGNPKHWAGTGACPYRLWLIL